MLRTRARGGRSPRNGFRTAIACSYPGESGRGIPRTGRLKTETISESLLAGARMEEGAMNESALNINVGYRLRSLRMSRNIKQADAARDLGVSPAYLNLIEKGKRVMPFPLLWKALRYFEQDPEQFMSSL